MIDMGSPVPNLLLWSSLNFEHSTSDAGGLMNITSTRWTKITKLIHPCSDIMFAL
jgi:hypothetical protein